MSIFTDFFERIKANKKIMPPPTVHILTNRDLLYGIAISNLGRDASPADLAPDELGCAETLTTLINHIDVSIQWTNKLATASVFKDMMNGKHFRQITSPEFGDIIISPTKWDVIGHCGILGKYGVVMSNNSFKDSNGMRGIFDENYTLASWKRYFVDRKGLKTYFVRML